MVKKLRHSLLKREFKNYVLDAEEEGEKWVLGGTNLSPDKNDRFYFSDGLPCNDVNKEIFIDKKIFYIRADSNFWIVAALPYKFRILKTSFIARQLWPHIDVGVEPTEYVKG